MKKIIHLSDIHVGYDDCGVNFRRIIDNISFLKQPAENYIIIITGDIVNNATHSEQIDEATDAVEQLETYGYKVLVVPGNHDYGTGSWGNNKFVSIFKEKYFKNPDISYPKLDIIDEIAFIGLDSMAAELHWNDRFFSEGELGEEQLGRLNGILSDPVAAPMKKIVYLHHHPFDFKLGMQLKDRDGLRETIENQGVVALLFGHYHSFLTSAGKIFNGMWNIPRCYNGGSATHKNGNPGVHRVIDLSQDPRFDYDGNFI